MGWKTLLYDAIPSFIGGGLALLGVLITLWYQNWRADKSQNEIIQGVLQALYEELIVLWGLVDESVEFHSKESEQRKKDFFDAKLTIPQGFFTIYNSNASLIGQIDKLSEPEKLGSQIVRVYMLLQALLQAYKTNNELIDKYNDAGYDDHQEGMRVYTELLREHALRLREAHSDFTKRIGPLFEILEKRLSPKPPPVLPGFTNNST